MISLIDPKWEEEMLAVARDEHRMALQVMHEESAEGGASSAPPGEERAPATDESGERPRRGPRRLAEAEIVKE